MAEANAHVLFILKDTKDYFWKMKNAFRQQFMWIQLCCSPHKAGLQSVSVLEHTGRIPLQVCVSNQRQWEYFPDLLL